MNDNEGTVPQQSAHLEGLAATLREDLAEARLGLTAAPYDERLAKQITALERLMKGVLAKIEQLKRQSVRNT